MSYDFKSIEKKWQDFWDSDNTFAAEFPSDKPKFYALVEFPYPSGNGLHAGHPRPYTAMDIVSRKRRAQGFNVLYPIGWDAFGLPTENFAIKNHIHPEIVTKNNIARFKAQIKSLGLSFDWNREIDTTDPGYYHWTQWIFLQLLKKGLAYKKVMTVNWCTGCKVVLANEEVVGGVCERCGSDVVQKEKSQWMLKITDYAEKLLTDLSDLDFIAPVKAQQANWIGKSQGASVLFKTTQGDSLEVYTTRPDTLFGATYMVVSPEHSALDGWNITNRAEVDAYKAAAAKKSDFERTEMAKDKTGVKLAGVSAINPVNGKEIPVFISDYVLSGYGTGAIMAVPGHDTRDYEFAKKFGLEIVQVVDGKGADLENEAFTDIASGTLINSDFLNGLSVSEAKEKITQFLEGKGIGHFTTNYKLRDWVFARQRYWGEPIPVVHCDHCGIVPLAEDKLPLLLPEVESYEPTGDGESPLSALDEWVNTTCPACGMPAKRETDTMPQWAGSSWYFLRYCDPNNVNALAAKETLDYFMPVDWYNGGMEHTTLHLLYSRFWHKFLYDIGAVSCPEPYTKRTSHGMILGENGEKMSKSRGNVVNPDEIVDEYGADTLRLYEMFIGDFEKAATWSNASIRGCKRFLERVWALSDKLLDGESYRAEVEKDIHKTIKKVSEDIESLKFNTAIAAMMSLVNIFYDKGANKAEYRTLLLLLLPFAPHVAEELYHNIYGEYACRQSFPKHDDAMCIDDEIEFVVQINGKLKGKILINAAADKDEIIAKAKAEVGNPNVIKEIFVPGRLVNFIVR
jgi:leucyl-tRNA synthetase, eubacterial and mitochondrial family